jgi:hypothetical protein
LEAVFKVFGKASVAIEPSEGALDNPAPGRDDKAADGIGAFDDFDCPLADLIESGIELGPAVGAVGKDMAQPRIEIPHGGQNERCAIAILDVAFVDHSCDQQAVGVGEYVALTSFDLLASVIATRTGGLGSLDRVAVAALGLASRPLASRACITKECRISVVRGRPNFRGGSKTSISAHSSSVTSLA